MPPTKLRAGKTADHRQPQRPSKRAKQPALIAAYPTSLALAVPEPEQPVGRAWLAEQGLADVEVSAQHLRFTRQGGELRIEDVGSRNGTWLHGQPLAPKQPAVLRDGAIVRLGSTLFVYRAALEGPLAASVPLGDLVAPYGLRGLERSLSALAAKKPPNVLIEGETGTGKELLARVVAERLGRSEPYAPVNVAGVAPGVFDSQLFGHVAGAFSDARKASKGVVVAHDGGTVVLDEIGELALELQPKLLRLLENREVLPVGAERPVVVNVLLVAATNRSLHDMVEQGEFRRDLRARLAMARLDLPPLGERVEDLFAIARTLAHRAGESLDPSSAEVEAVERLMLHPWPENVRGLAATLARLDAIDPEPGLRKWAVEQLLGPPPAPSEASGEPLSAQAIEAALEAAGGSERKAATRLGISRGKLRRLLGKA